MPQSNDRAAEAGSGLPPSISIILPTIGRESLTRMLSSIRSQLEPRDECVVVGDGPQPWANSVVQGLHDSRFRYMETHPTCKYGNFQRDFGISWASGAFLMFCDDDDELLPDGMGIVRQKITIEPDRPHLFKCVCADGTTIGKTGAGFVPPNVKDKLGKWDSPAHNADQEFIDTTCCFYPAFSTHDEAIYFVAGQGMGRK